MARNRLTVDPNEMIPGMVRQESTQLLLILERLKLCVAFSCTNCGRWPRCDCGEFPSAVMRAEQGGR